MALRKDRNLKKLLNQNYKNTRRFLKGSLQSTGKSWMIFNYWLGLSLTRHRSKSNRVSKSLQSKWFWPKLIKRVRLPVWLRQWSFIHETKAHKWNRLLWKQSLLKWLLSNKSRVSYKYRNKIIISMKSLHKWKTLKSLYHNHLLSLFKLKIRF